VITRKVGTSVTSSGSISVDRMTRSRTGRREAVFREPVPGERAEDQVPEHHDADTMALLRKNCGNAERESALGNFRGATRRGSIPS